MPCSREVLIEFTNKVEKENDWVKFDWMFMNDKDLFPYPDLWFLEIMSEE